MNINQAIASHFGIAIDTDKEWIPIKCPLHSDSTNSAAISFQHRMFTCLAGCDSHPFWRLTKLLNIEYEEIEETNCEFNNFIDELIGEKKRPVVLRKQVEAYSNFLIERKIKPETIEEFGGYYESREENADYGFLIVPYGRPERYVKRRIIGVGERFRNTSGSDKDLFGRDFVSGLPYIVVEGITDYFTLWQYRKSLNVNLVATLGAKVNPKQLYRLRREKVFTLFDDDFEGYEGGKKAKEILQGFGGICNNLQFPVRFLNDDTKTDINNVYVKHGDLFIEWLSSEINKYNSYDNFYIRDVFNHQSDDVGKRLSQFSTGLQQVDTILNGGFAAGIHAIAGRSGIGKSSLITELTCQAASYGKKVLSLSYELSKEQMWSRIASRYSRHNWSDIEKDKSILDMETVSELDDLSQDIKIELGWNIDQVMAAIDSFDVVIVDYIQRMEYVGNDRRVGIGNNVAKLSNLARDKNKIIFLISSMAEGTDNFKESGDILYASTSGWFLSKVKDNVTKFKCIKNTRGVADKEVYLEMDFPHQRCKEISVDLEWIK